MKIFVDMATASFKVITHSVRRKSLPRLIVQDVERLERIRNFMNVLEVKRHVNREDPRRYQKENPHRCCRFEVSAKE